MRAPDFWQATSARSWLVRLLQPLGVFYGRIVQRRATTPPVYRSRLPVICVGNMTMGGSGKTPVVQSIVQILQARGARPAILLRGYGGKAKSMLWVTPETPPEMAGDEAILHARIAPTLVSPDRVSGAQEIERAGYTHIVMDDGLQNSRLAKTLSFLVVDGGNPIGNGQIFPAGPLRETLTNVLLRVHATIILGNEKTMLDGDIQKPVFHARLHPVAAEQFMGKIYVAFAGIGRPEKFYSSLRECGAVLAATKDFADHHTYTAIDWHSLDAMAQAKNALLVTTRKDWVRLPPKIREGILVLDVDLQWQDKDGLENFLTHRI